jgi:hypothetical protein
MISALNEAPPQSNNGMQRTRATALPLSNVVSALAADARRWVLACLPMVNILGGKKMSGTYESYVYMKHITRDLNFPAMCAYCNQPANVDYATDNPLKVPHCAEHAKIIGHETITIHITLRRINKLRQTIKPRQIDKPHQFKRPRLYAPITLGAISAMFAGIFFYSRDIPMFRDFDRSSSSFVVGLITFVLTSALFYALGFLISWRSFSQPVKADQAQEVNQVEEIDQTEEINFPNTEAVKISNVYTGKYAGAYLLCFHSKIFADEFARLNSDLLLEKHDVNRAYYTPPKEQVRHASTSHVEVNQQTKKTTETRPPRPPESRRSQDISSVQPTPPASSENVELIVKLRKNLSLKVMYDEAKVERLIEYERRFNPKASLAELLQAAIDRWEHDNR